MQGISLTHTGLHARTTLTTYTRRHLLLGDPLPTPPGSEVFCPTKCFVHIYNFITQTQKSDSVKYGKGPIPIFFANLVVHDATVQEALLYYLGVTAPQGAAATP